MTLFEIGWTILIIKNFLRISDSIIIPEMVDTIISIICLGVLGLSILIKTYSKKRLLFYGIIGCLALYTGYITKYMILSISVLSLIAVCGENIKRIAQLTFTLQTALLAFNTIYSLVFAILKMDTSVLWGYFENGTRFRMYFGYGMPGHFADCILNLMIIWIYCNYDKICSCDYILLIGVAFFVYIVSDARIVLWLMFILIIGTVLLKRDYFSKLIKLITRWIVPVCSIFMILSVKLYGEGKKIGYVFDNILNTRVRLCGYNLDRYGITLFGHYCENIGGDFSEKWVSTGGTYDNAYMWMIINMGIIWLLLMMIIMYWCSKCNNNLLCLLMIVWALGMMIDTDFIYTTCCFSLLIAGNELLSKDDSKQICKGGIKAININMLV